MQYMIYMCLWSDFFGTPYLSLPAMKTTRHLFQERHERHEFKQCNTAIKQQHYTGTGETDLRWFE